MDRAVRILSRDVLRRFRPRRSHPRAAARGGRAGPAVGAGLALATCCALAAAIAAVPLPLSGCGSSGCQFEFEKDAVTYDGTPWVCSAGSGRTLRIAFFPDGTGTLDGAPFTWQKTFCRNVDLDPSDSTDVIQLSEVGGNREVGRLTFVLDGETFLCGLGVPPP